MVGALPELIWGYLIHLSYNMWLDCDSPDPEREYIGYRPYLRFDEDLFHQLLEQMAEAGVNMLVIDLGDAVRYQSHPEIAVEGAWSPAKLREELREELKRIQRETGITMIYVTHDQAEAMALADRLGVMEFGRLIQLGPPMEVYEEPETEFVARFIGASNLLSGEVRDQNGQRLLQLDRGPGLPLPHGFPSSPGPALVAIRPEEIIITRNGPGLLAKIKSATYLGNAIEYRLVVGGLELRARTGPGQIYTVGERVFVKINRATPLGPRRLRTRHRGPRRWKPRR